MVEARASRDGILPVQGANECDERLRDWLTVGHMLSVLSHGRWMGKRYIELRIDCCVQVAETHLQKSIARQQTVPMIIPVCFIVLNGQFSGHSGIALEVSTLCRDARTARESCLLAHHNKRPHSA